MVLTVPFTGDASVALVRQLGATDPCGLLLASLIPHAFRFNMLSVPLSKARLPMPSPVGAVPPSTAPPDVPNTLCPTPTPFSTRNTPPAGNPPCPLHPPAEHEFLPSATHPPLTTTEATADVRVPPPTGA